jgi:hypothetical protein
VNAFGGGWFVLSAAGTPDLRSRLAHGRRLPVTTRGRRVHDRSAVLHAPYRAVIGGGPDTSEACSLRYVPLAVDVTFGHSFAVVSDEGCDWVARTRPGRNGGHHVHT